MKRIMVVGSDDLKTAIEHAGYEVVGIDDPSPDAIVIDAKSDTEVNQAEDCLYKWPLVHMLMMYRPSADIVALGRYTNDLKKSEAPDVNTTALEWLRSLFRSNLS